MELRIERAKSLNVCQQHSLSLTITHCRAVGNAGKIRLAGRIRALSERRRTFAAVRGAFSLLFHAVFLCCHVVFDALLLACEISLKLMAFACENRVSRTAMNNKAMRNDQKQRAHTPASTTTMRSHFIRTASAAQKSWPEKKTTPALNAQSATQFTRSLTHQRQ